MNSFIGLVFLLLSSVYMCYGLLHCIAQYFVHRLHDSALATIIFTRLDFNQRILNKRRQKTAKNGKRRQKTTKDDKRRHKTTLRLVMCKFLRK